MWNWNPGRVDGRSIKTLFTYTHARLYLYYILYNNNSKTLTIKMIKVCLLSIIITIILLLYYFVNRIYEVEQASIVRIQAATRMKSITPIDYGYTGFFLWRNTYFARCEAARGRVLHISYTKYQRCVIFSSYILYSTMRSNLILVTISKLRKYVFSIYMGCSENKNLSPCEL